MKSYLLIIALVALKCEAQVKPANKDTNMTQQTQFVKFKLPFEGKFPSLSGATGWLNSQPLRPNSLHGKIVLVNFCTYTCINWLRELPYVRAWAEKYKDQGLVVLGVHTPEFPFEKNTENVKSELYKRKINYPIAIDNDYAIWNAFSNRYWPTLFFIDAKGNIRHHQFGEGAYEQSERIIQQMLTENGSENVSDQLVSVNPVGDEVAADWSSLNSPETYLGYNYGENLESPVRVKLNKEQAYILPPQLKLDQWALSGGWIVKDDVVLLNKANGRIACRFQARDLHLVMGSASPGTSIRFRVLIDGEPPGAAHGTDVDEQGNGTITGQRMYQLIRQPMPIIERQFEIEFLEAGAEAFVFTFG